MASLISQHNSEWKSATMNFLKFPLRLSLSYTKALATGTRQISKDSSQMISQAVHPLFVWAAALTKYGNIALNVRRQSI